MRRLWSDRGRAFAGEDLGQTLVEFALALPVFFFTVLVAIQFAVYVGEYYNVMQVTRETARWVAINPNTIDGDILTHARGQIRPGMLASKLTLTTTPACAALDAKGRCANRTADSPLFLDVTYDVSHAIFLPTSFRIGQLSANIPASLPTYRVSVPIE